MKGAGIPEELKERNQWVLWKLETRDGRPTKVPYTTSGPKARSNDPSTWAAFGACSARENNGFNGIGFVLSESDPYTVIDFDNCIDPATHKIDHNVMAWVQKLNSYTEVSQSGNGLHVIVKGSLPGGRRKNANVEMYDRLRFMIMTGQHSDMTPLTIDERQAAINELYHAEFGQAQDQGPEKKRDNDVTLLKDSEVIKKASTAKNGDKFKRLFFDGDTSGYTSSSEAELALCDLIHFFSGDDSEQIDRLFRKSELMRSKWNRDDYREMTIGKALNGEVSTGHDARKAAPSVDVCDITDVDRFFEKKTFVSKRVADEILNADYFLTFIDTEEIYKFDWEEGIYRPGGESFVRAKTQSLLGDRVTNHHIGEVEGFIRRNNYFDRDKLSVEPHLIPVKNCILDIRSGAITTMDYTPHVPYISKIAAAYDPAATSPEWLHFLESTVDPDDIPIIQEIFGDALYRDYWLKEALMLYAPGDNGKSVLLNVLNAMLGAANVSNRNLQDLAGHDRFATADLFGKFANIYADIDAAALRHTGVFKMATGDDRLPAQKKFCGSFSFKNYALLIFSANELPRTRDMSPAFYDRWILMEFPYVFVDDPAPDTNERKRDPELKNKLTTPEELSGVLNWSLIGLMRLLKNKAFTKSKSSENVKQRWITATDSLAQFVDAMVEHDPGAIVDRDTLYDSYLEFCEENDLVPLEKKDVTLHLPKLIRTKVIRPWGEGKRPRAWKDLSVSGITRRENLGEHGTQERL